MTTLPYFAFGSNLGLPRLRARIPEVEAVGAARLDGYELTWNKRSVDGSAKCNVVVARKRTARVYGALFRLPQAGQRTLDQIEAGYRRIEVDVVMERESVCAFTYQAAPEYVDNALVPFVWYRDLVVAGARAVPLPAGYVSQLRATTAVPDPDADRSEKNRSLLMAFHVP